MQSCEYIVDYKSILSISAGVMLVASEMLALSKKTKANGLFHLILIYFEKKFRDTDEEPLVIPGEPIEYDEEDPFIV